MPANAAIGEWLPNESVIMEKNVLYGDQNDVVLLLFL
jgi:hypothetical protein